MDPVDPSLLPRTIGRYEIQGELGRGMMGIVYQALDPALGRTVALKTVNLAFAVPDPAERELFEKRFLVEARSAARLSHPGIIVVHDVGRDPDTTILYIALEYLKGRTLAEMTAGGRPLPWREALRISARVAEALHHAHLNNVVHRDVKPANIMVLESGQPKIMDFGIAKLESGDLTAAGQFFGSPRYMAPEQALAQAVDGRTDLFALGSVLYGLLTGRAAFDANEVPLILTQVLRHDPPPPSHALRDLPHDVDYIVGRALAKAPEHRYQIGRDLADDLEDVLERRAPRHRASWRPPAVADATRVSARAPAPSPRTRGPSGAPEARATPSAPSPGAPREVPRAAAARGPWPGVVVAAGLATAVGLALAVWPRRAPEPPAPSEPASSAPASPAAQAASVPPEPEPAPATTSPATGETEPAAPPPAPASKPPGPREPRPPRPTVPAPDEEPAGGVPDPSDMARLLVDFEHALKSGTMRLWVDERLLLEEDLEGRVKRQLVGLKWRSGGFHKELPVAPGKHTIRVQVVWEDNDKSDTLFGTLEPGESRRVEVRVGRLRKNVSVEWK
jgi:serine/threonine-protein kinase